MDIQSILKQGHKIIKRKKWDNFIDFNTFDIDKLSSDDLRAKDWEYNDEIVIEPVFEKNWSYKITDPNHPKCGKTLWSGRYCAVTGIVVAQIQNNNGIYDYYVLANLRGPGTPDYQGYWNLPCGFLEANETGEEGVCREIFEECGFKIESNQMQLFNVETDPRTCNNGNVTIRYWNLQQYTELPKLKYTNINGEEGEVDSVKWINCKDINNYKWAFNHYNLIIEALFNKCGKYFGKIETITI